MKTLTVLGLTVAAFGLFLSPFASIGITEDDTGLETFYGAFIDDLISRCESKEAMCYSKCQSIRSSVSLYILKASFYRYHKQELIREMIEKQLGTNTHKIYYYLNTRFFDTLRDATTCVSSRYQLRSQNQSR